MKVIVDSREKQQAIGGILTCFKRSGIEYERRKLDVGDYMLDGLPDFSIDRKKSLSELCMNLTTDDRSRFYREIRRAREKGIRLVILCEERNIDSLYDVQYWTNPYGKVSGKTLQDRIYRLEVAYGVPVMYCDRNVTGYRIIELLKEAENVYQADHGRPGR